MVMKVYKNPLALRFIRCTSPIPGAGYSAGGTGWTLSQAMARCESELIERSYEIHELWPAGIRPLGIAAHLDLPRAREKAIQETFETLCLKAIHAEQKIRCVFLVRIGRTTIGISRTSCGYFCLIRGFLDQTPIAAYSAASSVLGAFLKAWEEYQSMHFFKPEGDFLRNFTKANLLFSQEELKRLPFEFEPRFIYQPDLSGLTVASAERSGRTIVYYFPEGVK